PSRGHPGAAPHDGARTLLTAGRPESVVINDLARPRFPDEVAPIREAMAQMGTTVVLEPDALMAAAVEQAGVDDFGDPGFAERLEVVCRALATDVSLSAAG